MEFFRERDIPGAPSKFPLNTSLGVQLEWFESMKPSLCRTTQGTFKSSSEFRYTKYGRHMLTCDGFGSRCSIALPVECKEFFAGSLFLVGEFGVNDYHFSFQRKSVREVRSYVPRVVSEISMAVEVIS